ncbi:putative Histidine kinase [Candidatus Zixiibacteriota bacterium]|nr:putative Histidine kinase [candidate division Zixibacteria bacterium]
MENRFIGLNVIDEHISKDSALMNPPKIKSLISKAGLLRRLETKIILMIFGIIFIFIANLIFSHHQDESRMNLLREQRTQERAKIFENIIELQGQGLKDLAHDYSFWDDMVKFVKEPAIDWAENNIGTALTTFDIDAVWVYRPDMKLVYSTADSLAVRLQELPGKDETIRGLISRGYFAHYFCRTAAGLMEIYSAPIQPSFDSLRQALPSGYFFVGRFWGTNFLEKLSHLARGKVQIIMSEDNNLLAENSADSGNLIISVTDLNSLAGTTVAHAIFRSPSVEMDATESMSRNRLLMALISSMAVIVLILILLFRWIISPLKQLARSLSDNNPSLLNSLKIKNTEFGLLARLVTKFYEQHDELTREVAERTHSEKALRENEGYLQQLLDSICAGILVVDAENHKIVDANEQALKMIGATHDEIRGRECHGYLCPAEKGKCPITDLKQTVDNSERRLIRTDGSFVPILKSVIKVRRKDKEYLIESFLDIARMKEAEMALHDTATKMAALADEQKILLENARDFLYRHDANGVFFYVSPSVQSITGYTPEEWCKHYTRYLTDSPDNIQTIEYTEDTLKTGNIHPPYLVEIYHKNGNRINLEVNEQPVTENGKVIGIVGVARDVTDRILMQERLRKSEEKYRNLVDNISDGLIVCDFEEKIIYTNPAACKILGYGPEEFIGLNFVNLVVPSDRSQLLAENQKRKLGLESTYVISVQHKSGETRTLFMSGRPYAEERGGLIGTVGVFTDITEMRRADEERLRLKEELARAQRMESMGVLAGGVAHDLNNILGPLVAYPEMILHKLPDESPARKQVAMMGRAAREAADVIQDLLSLARRGRYEMKPTNINDVIEEYLNSPSFVELCRHNPGVEIAKDLNREIYPISGSAPHLLKVIMNLIVNAFDAMPDGGRLSISTIQSYQEELQSGFKEIVKGKYVAVHVKDTGMGIDEKDLKKIFEPYYSKKKMGASGSGLGLSVVYGIVKDHKGYYDVISEVGRGTEFILYFPAIEAAVIHDSQNLADLTGTETILIIDDMPEQCETASQIIGSLGYHTVAVEGGREAVAFLKSASADLVIIDMLMEKDFDGLETYRKIREINPTQRAIIASGYSVTDRVLQMQAMGAGAFIKKPYTRDQIGRAIREELNRTPKFAPVP